MDDIVRRQPTDDLTRAKEILKQQLKIQGCDDDVMELEALAKRLRPGNYNIAYFLEARAKTVRFLRGRR